MTKAATAGGSGIWDAGHRALSIGLILTVSMAAFEALAVATILPATVGDIGGLSLYGWVFSTFMLAEIVAISAAGRAADRRGLAAPFSVGGVLFCAGLAGAGVAPSMPLLIACRALQGLGAGALSTLAYAAIARGYDDADRPRMLALLSTAWVVPGLIGPALSGAIATYAGWRWVFLGLLPLSAVAVALALPSLRRLGPVATGAAPSRSGAALALTAGTAAVLVAAGFDAPLAALALGGPALLVALWSFNRLAPPGTLRARPGLPAAVALMGLLSAAFFAAEVFVPLSLTEVRQHSVAFAGVALTAATLAWTAGAWLQARLIARAGRRALVAVGLVLIALGIVAVAGIVHPAVPVALAPLGWGVAGLGMGLAYSTTALVVLECAPPGGEGEASAALQLANVLGTAIGIGLGGAVLARLATGVGGTSTAIWITDGLALAAALAALALTARLPSGAPQQK